MSSERVPVPPGGLIGLIFMHLPIWRAGRLRGFGERVARQVQQLPRADALAEELPLNKRDFSQLLLLAAGTFGAVGVLLAAHPASDAG